MPLSGVKRSLVAPHMSAFDPKRTCARDTRKIAGRMLRNFHYAKRIDVPGLCDTTSEKVWNELRITRYQGARGHTFWLHRRSLTAHYPITALDMGATMISRTELIVFCRRLRGEMRPRQQRE